MRLVYRVTNRQRLIVVAKAVEQMRSFAQTRWWQTEAGGVLLGRHLIESSDIVVDEVTTPQSEDRRSRASFFRSKKHEQVARDRWKQQANTLAYLGLWHTHPEIDPTPSGVDRRDWSHAIGNDVFDGDRLFFPIVGTKTMRVWTLNRRGVFRELKEERGNG